MEGVILLGLRGEMGDNRNTCVPAHVLMSGGSRMLLMESYILKSTCFRCTPAKIVLGPLGRTETFQLGENFPRHGAANHTTYGVLSHTPEITWNTEGKHCQNCTFNEIPSSIKTWVLCLWKDTLSITLSYFPPNKWLECWSYAVSSGHK